MMKDEIGTMEDVMVAWRPWNPAVDSPFIYASWRNGAYYGANKHRLPSEFFPEMTAKIKSTLERLDCGVRVACIKDAPEVIFGYAVISGDMHLEWCHVKLEYRGRGIAKQLCVGVKTVTPHLTKIGAAIVKKKNLLVKGDSNEQASGF